MRFHRLAMLTIAGWFMMVAPSPESLGHFDAQAPITRWSSHSPMFRNRGQCEAFRARVVHPKAAQNEDENMSDDTLVVGIPLWASRCVSINPSVDIPG